MRSKKTAKPEPVYPKVILPFPFINIGKHLEQTFELWTIKTPSVAIQIKRSAVFVLSLVITIYWPVQDLLLQALILLLFWTLISLTSRRINYVVLMTHMMLNISFFYYLTQVWAPSLIQR